MALRDDINAVRNNVNLTDEEKKTQIYQIKVDALVSRLSSFAGQSWTLDTITYRLNSVSAITKNGTLLVQISITRTKSGVVFDPVDVIRIVNPPIIHNEKSIEDMTNQERLAYVRHLISVLPQPGA